MMQIIQPICKSTVRWLSVFIVNMLLVSNPYARSKSVDVMFPEENVVTTKELTTHDKKQLECLTRNIYWESAQEPWEGKVAVAQVTMNRLEKGNHGSDICAVVYQRTLFNGLTVCQFSWTCEGKKNFTPSNEFWDKAGQVARLVYLDQFRLKELEKALFFHAAHINPQWQLRKIKRIGNHIFYGYHG